MQVAPERCVYVGDDERDIVAGLAAGMATVAASYGYLGQQTDPGPREHGLHDDRPAQHEAEALGLAAGEFHAVDRADEVDRHAVAILCDGRATITVSPRVRNSLPSRSITFLADPS